MSKMTVGLLAWGRENGGIMRNGTIGKEEHLGENMINSGLGTLRSGFGATN